MARDPDFYIAIINLANAVEIVNKTIGCAAEGRCFRNEDNSINWEAMKASIEIQLDQQSRMPPETTNKR